MGEVRFRVRVGVRVRVRVNVRVRVWFRLGSGLVLRLGLAFTPITHQLGSRMTSR